MPAENGTILAVSSVSKRFGGLLALDAVSFEVQRGEIFSVIGPNGAGKTTLFSCLVGTYPPTSGSVRFRGEDLKGLRNDEVVARGLVRTHQIVKPFRDMTVADNIRVGVLYGRLRLRGAKARERLGLAPASLLAPVDSASMLLIRTRLKSPLSPRTLIVRPSPLSRSIEMPGRRCRDSARFESGKSAMSSALMASSMTSEVFLVSMALRSEAR